jgi:hypothetical protein
MVGENDEPGDGVFHQGADVRVSSIAAEIAALVNVYIRS